MEIVRIGDLMYGYQEGYLYYLTITGMPRLAYTHNEWLLLRDSRELLI